jgi:Zn-dependent peptidase ImmA (M78 family)
LIPNKVKVAGINYNVQIVRGLMADNNIYGQVTYHNNRIVIDESMDEQRKEAVLVHEMFHAIMFEAGYDDQEEEMVRRVSNVLYQVMKDNQFDFVTEGGAENGSTN